MNAGSGDPAYSGPCRPRALTRRAKCSLRIREASAALTSVLTATTWFAD